MLRFVLCVVLAVNAGCLTARAYDELVTPAPPPPPRFEDPILGRAPAGPTPRSTASKVTFYALLPVWIVADVVTSPLQAVYVIANLPDAH